MHQDLPAPYLGLSMVDRELCQATIAGIDACLIEIANLSFSRKPLTYPEECSDEILDTMLAEVENDEEERLQNLLEACSDLEEESREPGAEVDDHGGDDGDSKTGLSPASPVRNLELNSEEYMECLVDDRMAEADAQMMADSDGDLSDRINAGFRALDRFDMGLRPVAKKTAKKPAKKPAVKPAAKPRGRPASSSKSSSKSRRAAPATTPKHRAAPATAPKSQAEKSHAKKNKKVNQPKPKNKARKAKKDENVLEKKLHSASRLHRDCSLLPFPKANSFEPLGFLDPFLICFDGCKSK